MKAIVTATIKQLKSIGIPSDDDFSPNVEVKIIDECIQQHPEYGDIAEVEYLYKTLSYHIPVRWLKKIDK